MSLVTDIQTICAIANEDYKFFYEADPGMNIQVDDETPAIKFTYLEETTQEQYQKDKFGNWQRLTQVNLFFGTFIALDSSAAARELIYSTIDTEVVVPFIKAYNAYRGANKLTNIRVLKPASQFDAGDISKLLQFTYIEDICLS